MKLGMARAKLEIEEIIEREDVTAGMVVRVHGDNLTLVRQEEAASGETTFDDRVRLTRMSRSEWGLSVKRHTGRWERTPFSGSMREMMDAVCTFMQHLVAPY